MFTIQTLSDSLAYKSRNRLCDSNAGGGIKDNLSGRGLAQVETAVLAVASTIEQIFNFFGGKGSAGNRALTAQDWATLVPFHGQYYDPLRTYLSQHIQYQQDLTNMAAFTLYHINDTVNNGETLPIYQAWFNELANERVASGVSYISVTIPTNQTIYPNIQSWAIPFITSFATYFYGQGLTSTTNVTTTVGGTNLTTTLTGATIGGMSMPTILLLAGAGILLLSQKD
jgi:hypothetical protein